MRLDQNKFESWLKKKPAEEIVGAHRDCHSCPIANFYHEASGGCEVVIFDDGNGYIIDRGYDRRPAPRWAANFIFSVDCDEAGKISAGRALQVLREEA